MKKLLLFIAMTCTVASLSAQGEVLRLNLKKGQVFTPKMTTENVMTQNVFGQEITINMTMDGALRYEVTAVESGNFVMDASYTSLSMEMKSPAAQLDMSGSSENVVAGDSMSEMLAAMTNQPFTMTMSPTGRVLKVENVENLYSGISGAESGVSGDSGVADQIQEQLKGTFNSESLKKNMEMGMAMFPETAVSVGDSWNEDITVPGEMPMTIRTTYTLMENNKESVLIHGEAEFAINDMDMEQSGISMKVNFAGTMSIEMKLDPVTKWTVSSKVDMLMDGTYVISKSEQIPMDMTIPMKMTMTMVLE